MLKASLTLYILALKGKTLVGNMCAWVRDQQSYPANRLEFVLILINGGILTGIVSKYQVEQSDRKG